MADQHPTDDAALVALAERLLELREEKRYLEGEIDSVSAELAAAVGQGARRTLGAIEIRVAEARPGLRIVSEEDVPVSFLTPKPDRKRLLESIRETGEVPGGVEVTEGRPAVYARLLASD